MLCFVSLAFCSLSFNAHKEVSHNTVTMCSCHAAPWTSIARCCCAALGLLQAKSIDGADMLPVQVVQVPLPRTLAPVNVSPPRRLASDFQPLQPLRRCAELVA